MLAERTLDFLRLEAFAVVQAIEECLDDLLGFVLAEILDKSIVKMLSGQRVVDLGFFVMILQFGKVADPVSAGILGLAIDLEHHLVGLEQHKIYSGIKAGFMVTTVVFDVGETLVNESRLWRLWADWLAVPEHVLFAAVGAVIERGDHHRSVFEIVRPGLDIEATRRERRAAGVPDVFEPRDFYPDAVPCLEELHRRGLRIGIAGNQPEGMEEVCRGLPVDFVASSERWGVEKPSPLFFQKVIDESRTDPAAIAYIGDRLDNDILPAHAAGMLTVFLRRGPWGYLHALRPEAAQANLRIDGLGELPEALERWRT